MGYQSVVVQLVFRGYGIVVVHRFAIRYLDLAAHLDNLVGLVHLLGHTFLNAMNFYVQPILAQRAERIDRIAVNAYS